jgi:hypothetical protein
MFNLLLRAPKASLALQLFERESMLYQGVLLGIISGIIL